MNSVLHYSIYQMQNDTTKGIVSVSERKGRSLTSFLVGFYFLILFLVFWGVFLFLGRVFSFNLFWCFRVFSLCALMTPVLPYQKAIDKGKSVNECKGRGFTSFLVGFCVFDIFLVFSGGVVMMLRGSLWFSV